MCEFVMYMDCWSVIHGLLVVSETCVMMTCEHVYCTRMDYDIVNL